MCASKAAETQSSLLPCAQGAVRDLDILGGVKTGKGVAYALLPPSESLTNVFLYAHGELCITLWRMFGASLLMLPTWAVSLKVHATPGSYNLHAWPT